MNHCIGIPAAELTIVTSDPVPAVATAPLVATLPSVVPRAPVFLRSIIQSVYVFTGRMKVDGIGASASRGHVPLFVWVI